MFIKIHNIEEDFISPTFETSNTSNMTLAQTLYNSTMYIGGVLNSYKVKNLIIIIIWTLK